MCVVPSVNYEQYTATQAFRDNLILSGVRGIAARRTLTEPAHDSMKPLFVRLAVLKVALRSSGAWTTLKGRLHFSS